MQPNPRQFRTQVGGQEILIETGHLAGQAGGAVTFRQGDTMLLAAATMADEARSGTDFLPLTVDYEERMYAGGRIPGSFFRREGRPSEQAILTDRLTDRTLRPMFNKYIRNNIQIILYSLSHDGENPIDILAINAASTAIMISDIPFDGPVAAVRVGRINEELIVNPTFTQQEESDLNLVISGSRDAILMVEAGAEEVSEDVILAALDFAHKSLQPLLDIQEQMAQELGKEKRTDFTVALTDEAITAAINERAGGPLRQIFDEYPERDPQRKAVKDLREELVAALAPEEEDQARFVKEAFEGVQKAVVRSRIIDRGLRPDGRSPQDIRHIWSKVDVSPQTHGSGLFTRGETQVLTLATLGTPREAQAMDNLTPTETKRYIHHYNFPPFSTGEARFLRGSSRREIGHGALAERALLPVIPEEAEFPYTLRLVSEVLSSNGSTSMAAVCGSTLALMDTGVPIKSPVAGVAMGLIKEGDQFAILSDIQGMEDFLGDMDFKVAGTTKGITALQMDIKIKGIPQDIMRQALEQARVGRLHILDKMMETLSAPRPELKPHAPRITVIQIPIEKIGAVIGPGGKTVRALQEETGARIDIQDDGSIFIAASDGDAERSAREQIEALTETPKIGHIYTGRVVRTTDFGAFIEILPNTDGMVHISQLDSEHVKSVTDVVRVGDEVTVMITDIDPTGRIRLSRQAVLEGWTAEEAIQRDQPKRSSGGSRGGRPGGRRSDRRGGSRRGPRNS